ncbi:MAG: VOC family protein, partial [Rhodospirillaceae bacterium]
MSLNDLHHCSIRTDKLEETKEFFVGALGMEIGDRPPFPFPGYWLYAEGEPVVHLVGIDPDDPSGLIQYLGDAAMDGPTGAFDHMAFNISEAKQLRKHFKKNKIPFTEREVPGMKLQQFFLKDPNGVTVELNYWGTPAAPQLAPEVSPARRLMGVAREMGPDIAARAEKAEKSRRIPKATLKDLEDTGLMGIVQPARVGGAELTYWDLLEATSILSEPCGSTGWVYVNIACHHWMIAMFPPEAQADVWTNGPAGYSATSVIYPCGKARKVKGGFELSGRWPFCSGVLHSDWIMLGGMIQTKGRAPEARLFLVPKTDVTLIDTWDVTGLAATGSLDCT